MPSISRILILLVGFTLPALIASASYATSRYDAQDLTIHFSCVEVVDDGITVLTGGSPLTYELTLSIQGDQLSVIDLSETSASDDCTAVFETRDNTLTDETRVVDEIYNIQLQYEPDTGLFSVLSVEYARRGKTSLWEISNGENILYLGGTIHILRESDFPLPQSFLDAYQQAESIIFETDPSLFVPLSAYADSYLPAGQSLTGLLAPETILLVNQYLISQGTFLLNYDRAKPEFFEIALFYLAVEQWGFGDGVDDFFVSLALAEGKTTGGLETTLDQVRAIDASTDHENIDLDALFVSAIETITSGRLADNIATDIVSWREGVISKFAESNQSYKNSDPVGYEAILSNRNRNWIPVIEQYLATEEVELILAGFSHFAGPDNVLQLLEELGYSVKLYIPE